MSRFDHDLPSNLKFSTKAKPREMELHHAYEMLTKYRRELKKLILVDLRLTDNEKRCLYNERDRLDAWIYKQELTLKIRFEGVSAGEWEYENVNGY